MDSKTQSDTDGDFTFSNKLLHKFGVVKVQSENGMFLFDTIRSFFEQYAELQAKFASDLQHLANTHVNKLMSANEPDRMDSCWNVSLKMLERMGAISKNHHSIAKNSRVSIVTPLKRHYEKGMQNLNTVISAEKKLTGEMKRREEACAMARKKSTKLLDSLPPTSTVVNSLRKKMSNVQEKEGRGRLGAVNSAKRWVFNNTEKNRERARQACLEYQHVLSEATFYQKKYLSFGLPNVLSQLQSLEKMRIHTLKKNFSTFSQLQKHLAKQNEKLTDEMIRKVTEVNAEMDIEKFITRSLAVHGNETNLMKMFKYNLDYTPDDLKSSNYASDGSIVQQGLFNTTLENVMKLQKSSRPLPRILTTLSHAVKVFGGYETEGIFRLSASTQEKNQLKRQLERGDYTIAEQLSPHVPAALLKEWLRSLTAPLIPTRLYKKCIELGAKDSDATDFNDKRRSLMQLLAEVPPLNLRVIDHMAKVVKRVADKKDINKMGLPNLAIVFAPSFLRDPSGSVLVQMENTQFEARFLIYLFEALAAPAQDGEPHKAGRFSVSYSQSTATAGRPSQSIANSHRASQSTANSHRGSSALSPKSSQQRKAEVQKQRQTARLQTSDFRELNLPTAESFDEGRNEAARGDVFEETIKPQELAEKLPANWEMYQDDDGTPYYCNLLTQATQWEFPTRDAQSRKAR